MSAPEEVPENDQPPGSAPTIQEVSGGHHGKILLGGQYGQYIGTQVNTTFNPVGAFAKPQKPGQFQVSCHITVFEKDPISLSSRIFEGSLHSNVTGDRDAAIKITAAQKQNYREAKIYFSVPHHKNIVERFATDTFNFRGQPSIFIAMERCDCNLYNHVMSEKKDRVEFNVEKYTWIAYQILVGLDFLHTQPRNVVHGDFKPANVLLILNGNIVKLTDFGLSRAITQGNTSTQLTSPQGGTTGWQAPEILKGATRISKASDIFPCGLTLHFVWSHGKHAYGDETVSLNHYIVKGINLDLSQMLVPFVDDAKVLLEKMLQRDRADRPSVREILQSRIFSRFIPQPVRTDDVQVVELCDQALRFTNPRGAEAANLSEDPLPISARQLQTAMQSFLERNQLKLIREPSSPQATPISYGSPRHHLPRSTSFPSLSTPPLPQYRQRAVSGSYTDFPGYPLCRRGCDIIFMSQNSSDEKHLPELTSQIYGRTSYNGRGEFFQCDDYNPEIIQERLSKMPACDEGITTIIVAHRAATLPLIPALEQNNLRKFLQNKGLAGEDLRQKIQQMRRNLAIFLLDPSWKNISHSFPKIAVNIELSEDEGDGKLQTVTLEDGKVVNKITFKGKKSGDTFHRMFDFISNEEVMAFIRMNLQRFDEPKYCYQH